MLAITWSLAYIMCKQQIDNNEKCRQIAGDFDCHPDAAVGCGAHCPMEHILGFTWSHWMSPSSEWLHRIAAVAAMADDFSQKTKHWQKPIFASPTVDQSQKLWEFRTPNRTLSSAHQYNKLHYWSWRAWLNFYVSNGMVQAWVAQKLL